MQTSDVKSKENDFGNEEDRPVTASSDDKRLTYGWGNIRPRFLRFLNHPWCFLVILMLLTVSQSTAILGIFLIVSPQIEKRFSLSSTDVGLIAGANDIAALIVGLFISYYGDYANKVRWISLGGVVSGLGMILFAMPHFVAGRYQPLSTLNMGISMCNPHSLANSTRNDCPEDAAVEWYYMATFCTAQLIAGAGVVPLYALSPAFFEDNTESRHSPIYIGFWSLASFGGPLFGFAVSDSLTNLYVDITQPEGVNLTPKDPRWIGNWWVGFLSCGLFLIFFSLLLLGFPEHFKPKEEAEQGKNDRTARWMNLNETRERVQAFLRELLSSFIELMTNVTFVCNCAALIFNTFVTEGIAPFVAKLLFLKYGVEVSNLGKFLVAFTGPGIVVGSVLGGIIVSKLGLENSCKKSALVCVILQTLCIGIAGSFLIPGCENPNLAGLSVDYGKRVVKGQRYEFRAYKKTGQFLQASCNEKCGCSRQSFLPLCGSDNISYYDPCHAGCTGLRSFKPLEFVNCSCISSSNSFGGTAEVGFCDADCKNWFPFLLLAGFMTLFTFTSLVPIRIVVLRSVPKDKQSFAIGLQYIGLKVLGNVPGPIVIGEFIDQSCDVWQDLCGQTGSCFVYDMDKMSWIIARAYGTCLSISVILYFISWWFVKPDQVTEEQPRVVVAMENVLADPNIPETDL